MIYVNGKKNKTIMEANNVSTPKLFPELSENCIMEENTTPAQYVPVYIRIRRNIIIR